MSELSDEANQAESKEKLLQNDGEGKDESATTVAADEAKKEDATEKEKPISEMSTKEAYFASLNAWAKQAAISQNAMAMFPLYLLNSYPQLFQNQTTTPPATGPLFGLNLPTQQQQPQPAANVGAAAAGGRAIRTPLGTFRVLDDQAQQEIINRNGGYDYVVAPFWKRAIAEAIDWLILLLLKIIVTFTIMNLFDLDMGFEISKEVMRKALEDDEPYTSFLEVSLDFITLSSDLLLIELLTKFIVCCYEAFWTTWYNGATPGKALLKIKIKYVEAVLPLQAPLPPQFILQPQREPVRALLYPAETPGLKRAFMRAVAKNLVMTLLFPICVIMVFFKNNRTAYDIITKTIVVEANPNPNFRRQQ